MPPLPKVKTKMRNGSDFTTPEHAQAVANVLAGRMGPKDRDYWATVTRAYFMTHPKAANKMVTWFEEQ